LPFRAVATLHATSVSFVLGPTRSLRLFRGSPVSARPTCHLNGREAPEGDLCAKGAQVRLTHPEQTEIQLPVGLSLYSALAPLNFSESAPRAMPRCARRCRPSRHLITLRRKERGDRALQSRLSGLSDLISDTNVLCSRPLPIAGQTFRSATCKVCKGSDRKPEASDESLRSGGVDAESGHSPFG
jgi:hypothetical protein